MENNEPNKREFELAEEFAERLRFMKSHGGYSLQEEAAAILSEYRAELLAPDREAAEKIISYTLFWGEGFPQVEDKCAPVVNLRDTIAAALAAARQAERAKWEAAAQRARGYLDRISDEWDNSPTDTAFDHSKAHEAYCISEELAALVEEVKSMDKKEIKPGEVYIEQSPNDTEMAGPNPWQVLVMGDGTLEGDTARRGIFWNKEDAELFMAALVKEVESGE